MDALIRNYIIAIAAWCFAALLCYLPWRLLYLKRKGKPVSVLREVCLALFVCYTVGFLSQTIFPEIQLFAAESGSPELSLLFPFRGTLTLGKDGAHWYQTFDPLFRCNLVPFRTIWSYLSGTAAQNFNLAIRVINLLGNVLILVPFGILLPFAFPKADKWKWVFLWGSVLIVFVEVTQYFIGRAADIDDWLLNILGVLLGYAVTCVPVVRRWKDRCKADRATTQGRPYAA